jgi:acyl carrier protein
MIRLEGDEAAIQDLELFQDFSPSGCVLVNGLGTTETGIWRQYFFNKTDELPKLTVPIGYPVEDMEVLIVDSQGNEFPDNQAGEIAVRSRYLCSGYWNDPNRTAEVLLKDGTDYTIKIWKTGDLGQKLKNGCLEYLGRKDSVPDIHIQKNLPKHAKSKRFNQKEAFTHPSTSTEKTLASIWTDVLNLQKIDIHEDFFSIGGDSLQAVRLVGRIQSIFSVTLSIRDVFDQPTFADQVLLLENKMKDPNQDAQEKRSS